MKQINKCHWLVEDNCYMYLTNTSLIDIHSINGCHHFFLNAVYIISVLNVKKTNLFSTAETGLIKLD